MQLASMLDSPEGVSGKPNPTDDRCFSAANAALLADVILSDPNPWYLCGGTE